MKVKAKDLSGAALDWAVARIKGRTLAFDPMNFKTRASPGGCWVWEEVPSDFGGVDPHKSVYLHVGTQYSPSTKPEQGMPIMEEMLGLELKVWLQVGLRPNMRVEAHVHNYEGDWIVFGPTILIAAMRCYVAYKMGDEIEVPDYFKEQA